MWNFVQSNCCIMVSRYRPPPSSVIILWNLSWISNVLWCAFWSKPHSARVKWWWAGDSFPCGGFRKIFFQSICPSVRSCQVSLIESIPSLIWVRGHVLNGDVLSIGLLFLLCLSNNILQDGHWYWSTESHRRPWQTRVLPDILNDRGVGTATIGSDIAKFWSKDLALRIQTIGTDLDHWVKVIAVMPFVRISVWLRKIEIVQHLQRYQIILIHIHLHGDSKRREIVAKRFGPQHNSSHPQCWGIKCTLLGCKNFLSWFLIGKQPAAS